MKSIHAWAGSVFGASLALASRTYAHPDHGTTDSDTLWHYLTEPVHLFVGLALVVSAVWLGHLARVSYRHS